MPTLVCSKARSTFNALPASSKSDHRSANISPSLAALSVFGHHLLRRHETPTGGYQRPVNQITTAAANTSPAITNNSRQSRL